MPTTKQVTREQAEATLAAIRHQYAAYLTEQVYPATEACTINGVFYEATPEMTSGPLYPEPTLMEDHDGHDWVIMWEEGPDEWAHRVVDGGPSEEDMILHAQAAKEFGVEYKRPTGPPPAAIPAEVWTEAIWSFAVAVCPR